MEFNNNEMRADAKRNVRTVANQLKKNPALSIRDLSKVTGLGPSAVQKAKKYIESATSLDDDLMDVVIQNNATEIAVKSQEEMIRRLGNDEERKNIKNSELNKWAEGATKQYLSMMGVDDSGGGTTINFNFVAEKPKVRGKVTEVKAKTDE